MVDCVLSSVGCSGGQPVYVFDYLSREGAELEADYAYTAGDTKKRGECHTEKSK